MPLFYPFGIPSTSSFAVSASGAQNVKATPQIIPGHALFGNAGPKGIIGTPSIECPAGYLDAMVENTVTYSGSTGFHTHTYPPVPFKGRRFGGAVGASGVASYDTLNNDLNYNSNAYRICYPVPTPTPTQALPASIVALTATTFNVTASQEISASYAIVDVAVQIRNANGNAIGYPVYVTWSLEPKLLDDETTLMPPGTISGSIISSSNYTDEAGNSSLLAWIAGPVTGSQIVKATGSGSLSGNPVEFEIIVVPSSSYHTASFASLDQYTVVAGETRILTVELRDIFGNLKTQVNGSHATTNAQFTASTSNGASLGTFSCLNGICSASLTPNNTAGGRLAATVTIGSVGNVVNNGTIELITLPTTASYLAITSASLSSGNRIAGSASSITVTMYDQYNNICNSGSFSGSGNVPLTFTGATAAPDGTTPTVSSTNFGSPTNVTFTNGIASSLQLILYDASDNPEVDTILASGVFPRNASTINTTSGLTITVSPDVAAEFYLTGIPTVTTDSTPTVTITARDAYENEVKSGINNYHYPSGRNLTFTGASNGPNGTVPTARNNASADIDFGSTTAVNFTNGVATSVVQFKKTETGTLTISDGTINGTYAITVGPGALNDFTITGTSTQIAGAAQTITVTARDTYDNVVNGDNSGTNYNGSISGITFTGAAAAPNGTNPTVAGTTFGSNTTLSFTNGVATPSMILYDATGQPENDTISITAPVASAVNLAVAVSPAAVNKYTVPTPGTQTAGVGFNVTISARDVYDNLCASGTNNYTGTKTVTMSSPGTAPDGTIPTMDGTNRDVAYTSAGFSNGTYTPTIILYDAESATLTFTTSGITAGSTSAFTVNPNTAVDIGMIKQSATNTFSAVAGASTTVAFTAYDDYRNVATGYAGTKSLTFSGANSSPSPSSTAPTMAGTAFGSPTDIAFTSGTATATMILYKVESATIDFDNNTNANVDPVDSGDTMSVTVTQAAPASIVANAGNNQTATVNTAVATDPQVLVRDTYSNPYNGGSVTFAVQAGGGSATGTSQTTDASGLATVTSWTLGTTSAASPGAGGNTLRATINALTVDFTATAQPDVTTNYTVTTPGTQTAGAAFNVTISARDQFGNLVDWGANDYDGSRTVTMTGPSDAPDTTVPTMDGTNRGSGHSATFSGGTYTPSIVLYKAETTTLTFTTSGLTAATTNNITVNAAAEDATDSSIAVASSTLSPGTTTTLTVTIKDTYQNLQNTTSHIVTANNGSVGSASNPSTGVYTYTYTAPTTTNTYANAITTTIGGNPVTNSPISITVQPAVATKFVVTGTGTQTAGGSQNITVTAYDQYNNVVDSGPNNYTGGKTITFSGASTAILGNVPTVSSTNFGDGTSVTFTNGVASGLAMVLYRAETANIVATDGSITTTGSDRLSVVVSHATENHNTLTYSSGGTSSGNMQAGGAGESGQSDYFVLVRARDVYGNTATSINGYYDVVWGGANTSPGGNGTSTAEPPKVANNDGDFLTSFGGNAGRTFTNGEVVYKLRLFKVETANLTARLYTNYPTNTTYIDQTATHAVAVALGPIGGGQGTMGANSATTQTPTVNTNATAPSVKITDDYGNPASGISVSFLRNVGSGCLVAGSGQTTNTSCIDISGTTDANGVITLGQWGPMPTTAADNASDYDEQLTAYCGTTPGSIVFYAAPQPAVVTSYTLTKDVGTATAGSDFNLTVTAKDTYNNTVGWGSNDYDGYVNIYFSGPNASPSGVNPRAQTDGAVWVNFPNATGRTFANGAATFPMTLYSASSGAPVLTASSGYSGGPTGLTGTISIAVNPASMSTVSSSIAVSPTASQEGAAATVTLTAKDTYQNPVTGSAATVTANSGSFGTQASSGLGTYTWVWTSPTMTPADADSGTSLNTLENAITATISATPITNSPLAPIIYDTYGTLYDALVCGNLVPDGTAGAGYEEYADGAGDFYYTQIYNAGTPPCCGDLSKYDCGPNGSGTCCNNIDDVCCSDGLGPQYYCCGNGATCAGGNCA